MLKVKRPFDAYLDEMNKITILLPHAYGTSRTFRLQEGSNVKELPIVHTIALPDATKYECFIEEPIDVGKYYTVRDERNEETDLQIGAVIRTVVFDEKYYYEGTDLGAVYKKKKQYLKYGLRLQGLRKYGFIKVIKNILIMKCTEKKAECGFIHCKVIMMEHDIHSLFVLI